MQLHFAPRTRAVRPRWLLEELGAPYELVRVEPTTDVPVLVDGEVTLSDPTAICLYLADHFADKRLAPSLESPDRGPYLQWLLFAEVTLDPLVVGEYLDAQLPAAERADRGKERARLDDVLAVVDERLDGRDFIAGDSFTAADVVMASILHLANTMKLLEGRPRLTAYVMRHSSRPAVRRALG